jgi:ornithine decarboxylase
MRGPGDGGAFEPRRLAALPYATPFLFMDLAVVRARLREFRRALPGVEVHFATKCNPDEPLARFLHGEGCWFEIASRVELELLQATGVDPREVLFSNPVKAPAHIEAAAAAGVRQFAFDSADELGKIARLAPGAGVYVRLATAGRSVVPSEGKFGVEVAPAMELMRRAAALGLRPLGVSFHVGSQMESPAAWPAAIRRCGELMRGLLADGIRLELLDVGGGFPAYYGARLPELAAFGRVIRQALEAELPYRPARLAIEPGRGLVGDAGVMVATVIGVAQRGRKRWAHLDVGVFNGLMEALETGNALRFPLADSRGPAAKARFNLTGPSCDSQDTILFDCELSADLAVGDRVFIYAAGAYTTSYASRFNAPVRASVARSVRKYLTN